MLSIVEPPCQGGGVFDPACGLKISDFAGNIASNQLLATMNQGAPKAKSKGGKKKGTTPEEVDEAGEPEFMKRIAR